MNDWIGAIEKIDLSYLLVSFIGPLSLLIPFALMILVFKKKNKKFSERLLLPLELEARRNFKLKAVRTWHGGTK